MRRLVLVHGSLSSASEWARYDALLAGFDVVRIDLPGHGSRVDQPYRSSDALEAITDAVQGHPDAILVGHSLGGYLATQWAAQHPNLAGLVLISASGDPSGPLAGVYKASAWLIEHAPIEMLAKLRDRISALFGARDSVTNPSSYRAIPASWRAIIDECPPELISSIQCPILFINGQFDQMRINERAYVKRAKNAQLVVIAQATHIVVITHAPQVAAAIKTFAHRISASVDASSSASACEPRDAK